MAGERLRVACIGMGWWSDVLADAIKRSKKLETVACYTRTEEKRKAFAAKYGCKAVGSYDDILKDRSIDAVINTTPNNAHRETTCAAAAAGKHVFLDKPIATTIADGRAITEGTSFWPPSDFEARPSPAGRGSPARFAPARTPGVRS